MKNIKQVWCELFNTHKWRFLYSKTEDGIQWQVFECEKCKMRKEEQVPIMLPSIFTVGDSECSARAT